MEVIWRFIAGFVVVAGLVVVVALVVGVVVSVVVEFVCGVSGLGIGCDVR